MSRRIPLFTELLSDKLTLFISTLEKMRALSIVITIVFGLVYSVECTKQDCTLVRCLLAPDCTKKAHPKDCCNYCPKDIDKVCPPFMPYDEPQCDGTDNNVACKKTEGCCKDGCGLVCKKREQTNNDECVNENDYNCANDSVCKENEKCCPNACGRSCLKAVKRKGKRCGKSSDGQSYIQLIGNSCKLCYCNDGVLECNNERCPCKENGKLYRHLQDIPTDDPCEDCSCDNGKALCAVMGCAEPDCDDPNTAEGECCPTCP